ncbi:hypothetical protein [Microvirga puerhi]|uniref:N-acetyltransferase domain-containing protein n=1 Tax=Microvirga puerhi TaxID=2876078 RepID=A0ABS7VLT2_9HYPH|nr:hypothetical protein [Microvirga puerhi]MBZ6076504.1 hypothetical protein [Microvirga puerhi]
MEKSASTSGKHDNLIRAEVVTTPEQLLHAYAIRAICFLEEHGVPARQTYDGNDYQATHIIVYAEDEPIGTARIRWFKDFAKMERTSFRKAWRDPRTIKKCAEFIFDHISRKGYDRVITHAQPTYARLWRSLLGFRPVPNKDPLYFEGHDEPYLELIKELNPPKNAITADSDTAVLFRIEGQWDDRSEFEARRT